jgi:hypothetical protein
MVNHPIRHRCEFIIITHHMEADARPKGSNFPFMAIKSSSLNSGAQIEPNRDHKRSYQNRVKGCCQV